VPAQWLQFSTRKILPGARRRQKSALNNNEKTFRCSVPEGQDVPVNKMCAAGTFPFQSLEREIHPVFMMPKPVPDRLID
jgi:hypothetical protein